MVLLIGGASHTGKTALAQQVLERFRWPYLSIDHLKMGLIRSGQTSLTPEDDKELTGYLWPIVREIVKTAVENRQNLVIEGCYIPYDWQNSFEAAYRQEIQYICLVMTQDYVKNRFDDIRKFASVIETRLDDAGLSMEDLAQDNLEALAMCQRYGCPYILIEDSYDVFAALEAAAHLRTPERT